MAMGQRLVSDALAIMRTALGRNNLNDPNSTDAKFLSYLNNFVSLTMSSNLRVKELFGTLTFTISEANTTGVYTFNDVGATNDFMSISNEGLISILDPINNSVSWNKLYIYQDPGEFFLSWGINNVDILIPGFPTAMLWYGNQMTFRTIPEQSYQVVLYGYLKNNNYASTASELQYDYWLRYVAYGAAVDYARDFRYPADQRQMIEMTFANEKANMLTNTHNTIKQSRCYPRF